MRHVIFATLDCKYNSEPASKCSDKEGNYCTYEAESDVVGVEPDTRNPQHNTPCGTLIQYHIFSEGCAGLNLYAAFQNPINYWLARFFKITKTSQTKIDHGFNEEMFKGRNATYHVQFLAAYTLCKLVNAAASGPCWHECMVNYGLQNRVPSIIVILSEQ